MPLSAYAKAIAAFVATLAAAFVAANTDNVITQVELVQLVILAADSALVLIVPNLPTGPGRYTKQALAFVGAAGVALVPLLTGGTTLNEWVLVVLAGLQVLGVVGLPNDGYVPRHSVAVDVGSVRLQLAAIVAFTVTVGVLLLAVAASLAITQ